MDLLRRFLSRARSGSADSPAMARADAKYSIPADNRIYAVGDIHGRLDLLKRMHGLILADLAANPVAQPRIVYLGDYIDRGMQSRGVIDLLLDPPAALPPAIMLRGNHEQTLLDCLAEPDRFENWRDFGGVETLMSYGVPADMLRERDAGAQAMAAFAELLPRDHLQFYDDMIYRFTAGGYFFCHAGVRPGVPLDRQTPHDLMWIRQEFMASSEDFGAIVVHGHTPASQPTVERNRIGVDTGAYATGVLTAAVADATGVRFLST